MPTFDTTGLAPSGQSSSSTYFAPPGLQPGHIQGLVDALSGTATGAAGMYLPFIQNPTQSPLFQNQLSGLLEALGPSEKQARQGLGDEFRAAGNLASGQFGTASSNLESDILRNRQTLASQLLGQSFGQETQALQSPMNQITALLQALKLQQGFGAGGGQMAGGGAGGGATSDPFGMLQQFNSPNVGYTPGVGMAPQYPGQAAGGGATSNDPFGFLRAFNNPSNPGANLGSGTSSGGGVSFGADPNLVYSNLMGGYVSPSQFQNTLTNFRPDTSPGIGMSNTGPSGFTQDPNTGMWSNPPQFDMNSLMAALEGMTGGGGVD